MQQDARALPAQEMMQEVKRERAQREPYYRPCLRFSMVFGDRARLSRHADAFVADDAIHAATTFASEACHLRAIDMIAFMLAFMIVPMTAVHMTDTTPD